MRHVSLILSLWSCAFAQTFDLSDRFGVVPTELTPITVSYSGAATASPSTHTLTGPKGAVAWQRLHDGRIAFIHPQQRPSVIAYTHPSLPGLTQVSNPECPPYGAAHQLYGNFEITGVQLVPGAIPNGAVSSNLTAGQVYYAGLVGVCPNMGHHKLFEVLATPNGTPVTLSSRGTTPWDMTYTGATWDGGDGLRIHPINAQNQFEDGDPVRFECVGSCTLPAPLTENTTYYLDFISTDIYDVYSNPGLTSKITVDAAGTGINQVISYAVYTLTTGSSTVIQSNPVRTTLNGSYLEITNGLVGVRIPAPGSNCANWSAIQGLYTGSTWVAASDPNPLKKETGTTYPQVNNATDMDICRVVPIDIGPVLVHYRIEQEDAGVGYFHTDIRVWANYRGIDIEYDTTLRASMEFTLPGDLDTIRFRRALRTTPDDDVAAATTAMDYRLTAWNHYSVSDTSPRHMVYGLMYDADGSANSLVVGLAGGWIDRQIQTAAAAMRHIRYTGTSFLVSMGLNPASGVTRHRRKFLLWIGTKAEINTNDLSVMTPMALSSFQRSWIVSKEKLLSKQFASVEDPSGSWPYYLWTQSEGDQYVTQVRTNPTFRNDMLTALVSNQIDEPGRDAVYGWNAQTSAGSRAFLWFTRSVTRRVVQDFWTRWYNKAHTRLGTGIVGYYELLYGPMNALAGAVNTLKDTYASNYDKAEARRYIGFWCGVAADDNWAPIDRHQSITENPLSLGEGYGLQNQLSQAFLERQILFSYCRTHPGIGLKRVLEVENETLWGTFLLWFDRYGDKSGVVHNSADYINTAAMQLHNALSAIKANGGTLSSTHQDLLTKQVQQEFSITSPPNPKFSNYRMYLPLGDSSWHRSIRIGSAAKAANHAGAKWLWNQLNRPASSFFVGANYSYDWADNITPNEPAVGSLRMPKWASSLRTRWQTNDETWVFHVTGPAFDHMLPAQDGSVHISALKAQVSSWYPSFYAPTVADRITRGNNIAMDSELVWDADSRGLTALNSRFSGSNDPQATAFFGGERAHWSAHTQQRTGGPDWHRTVRLFHFQNQYPIITVRDTFTGNNATAFKVFGWNHDANGAVTIPGGSPYTPVLRDYTANQSNLPSNSDTAPVANNFNLTSNALNRYQFVGNHLVDWDWYVVPGGSNAQGNIGNWCGPYQVTDTNTLHTDPDRDCKHIARVRASGDVQFIWLPRLKAASSPDQVSIESCGVRVVRGAVTECWNDNQYQATNGSQHVLAAFSSATAEYQGLTVSGGEVEVNWDSSSITVTLNGLGAAERVITPPSGQWYTSTAHRKNGQQLIFYHPGGLQPERYQVTLTQTPVTMRDIRIETSAPAGAATAELAWSDTTRWIAQGQCSSGSCIISIWSTVGTHNYKVRYRDGAGELMPQELTSSYTVN